MCKGGDNEEPGHLHLNAERGGAWPPIPWLDGVSDTACRSPAVVARVKRIGTTTGTARRASWNYADRMKPRENGAGDYNPAHGSVPNRSMSSDE
jgi:hypothetical protein